MTKSPANLQALLEYIPKGKRRNFAIRHLAGEAIGDEVQAAYFQLNLRREAQRFPRRQFLDYAFALCALYPNDRNMAFNAASSLYEMGHFEAAAGWHLYASRVGQSEEGTWHAPDEGELDPDDSKYFVVLSLAERNMWFAALLHLQMIESLWRQQDLLKRLLRGWEP